MYFSQNMMMISRFIKSPTSLLLFGVIVFFGCRQSDYTKLVKSELAKGVREDSILLGINFGDARNEFYGKCFDLNKKQLVSQGPNNTSVQYIFTDSLVHQEPIQIRLLFYPDFDDRDVISNMDMEFSYSGWAPWNKGLQSDSLKLKVIDLLMKWYGGNEFVIAHPDNNDVPVKLDGNRRILLYVKDTQSVLVRVQDILHPKFQHSISLKESEKSGN